MSRLLADLRVVAPWAAVAVFAIWAIWIGLLVGGRGEPPTADSTADWLVASAARDGLDPYADLRELSDVYQVPYAAPGGREVGDAAWLHPRPPGALLLLQPVTLISPDALHLVHIIVSLGLLGVLGGWALPRLMERPWPIGLLLVALLILSGPLLRSLQFGVWSVVLTGLIAAFWLGARKNDSWWAGIPLGVALSLRLFPAFLLIPALLYRRTRATAGAVLVSGVLTAGGVLFLGLSPIDSVNGIAQAGDTWLGIGGNASVVKPVHQLLLVEPLLIVGGLAGLGASVLVWMRIRGLGFDHVLSTSVVVMLLVSPLSWEHYDVMMFLVMGVMLAKGAPRPVMWASWLWVGAMTVGFFVRQPWEQLGVLTAGIPSLIGRLTVLGVLVIAAFRFDPVAAGRGVATSTSEHPAPRSDASD